MLCLHVLMQILSQNQIIYFHEKIRKKKLCTCTVKPAIAGPYDQKTPLDQMTICQAAVYIN